MRDLDILSTAGIPAADLSLRFFFSSGDREKAMRKALGAGLPEKGDFAVIQPTSRWTFKCWTEEGMAGIVGRLFKKWVFPVVTSGPASGEAAMAKRIMERSGVEGALLAGSLSLKELGALIDSARLFVGVDSAPMHIAAAVGTPVVALFGPTGAYNWAPWQGIDWGYTEDRPAGTRHVGRHAVVQKEWEEIRRGKEDGRKNAGLEEISLAEAAAAVDRVLAASPER
jgi:heptosyltransferase-3